jgi:hypothetical protein
MCVPAKLQMLAGRFVEESLASACLFSCVEKQLNQHKPACLLLITWHMIKNRQRFIRAFSASTGRRGIEVAAPK